HAQVEPVYLESNCTTTDSYRGSQGNMNVKSSLPIEPDVKIACKPDDAHISGGFKKIPRSTSNPRLEECDARN
ncbi:MAG: hypothetical protein VYE53_13505, partial [Planctomycetota bacterium]|nr:hypothetical protein [Planctomycetota bacterium]